MLKTFSRVFFGVAVSCAFLTTSNVNGGGGVLQDFIGDFADESGTDFVIDGSAHFEVNDWMTLTDAAGDQNGGVYSNAVTDDDWSTLTVSGNVRFSDTSTNGGADGFGWILLPTDTFGDMAAGGDNPSFSEEVNVPGAFGVGFDTYDNGGEAGDLGDRLNESSVSIHWNGATVANAGGPQADPPFNFEAPPGSDPQVYNINAFIQKDGAGGSNVTVTMTNLTSGDTIVPHAAVNIPGMDLGAIRFGARARTGGAWNKQEQGNTSFTEDADAPANLIFSDSGVVQEPVLVGGTPYSSSQLGSAPGPTLVRETGTGGGVQPGFLRLSTAVNSQHNFMAFDQDGEAGSRLVFGARTGGANENVDLDNVNATVGPGSVDASFSLRFEGGGARPADGLGVVFARTSAVGTSGPADINSDALWAVAEDPTVTDSLGIGWRTWEDGTPQDDFPDVLRVRYGATDIATLPATDLIGSSSWNDGAWHDVAISVRDQGDDAMVTVMYDTTVLFSDVVPGAAGLGLPVPEPTSLGLLAFGLLGLAGLRRKQR